MGIAMGVKAESLNVLSLAYMGDAVWEQFVRARVISNIPDANHADYLHKSGVKYVNANAQAKAVKALINRELLSEEEVLLVKRARNHKTATKSKNADAITYKWATAFEALLGFMYLSKNTKRLNEIMKASADVIEE